MIRTPKPSHTHTDPSHILTQIRDQLQTHAGAHPLPWSPPHDNQRTWVLPASFRLAQFGPYRAGRVYGMDAASAAAVWALDPQPGEHILDLCCAPGLKLSAIADAMGAASEEGAGGGAGGGAASVTGVDVNRARLQVARKVAVKYRVGRPLTTSSSPSAASGAGGAAPPGGLTCRLLCADGVRFALGPLAPWDGGEGDVVFDSRAYDWQVGQSVNRSIGVWGMSALPCPAFSPPPSRFACVFVC